MVSDHFSKFGYGLASQAQWILHLAKSDTNVRVFKKLQKRWQTWALEEDLQRCMSRDRRSTRDISTRDMLGGQGADFLRGVAFWSIRSSGLLRWFCPRVCSTGNGEAIYEGGGVQTMKCYYRRKLRNQASFIVCKLPTSNFVRNSRRICCAFNLSTPTFEVGCAWLLPLQRDR